MSSETRPLLEVPDPANPSPDPANIKKVIILLPADRALAVLPASIPVSLSASLSLFPPPLSAVESVSFLRVVKYRPDRIQKKWKGKWHTLTTHSELTHSGLAESGLAGSGLGLAGSGLGLARSGLGLAESGLGLAGSGLGLAGSGLGLAGSGNL